MKINAKIISDLKPCRDRHMNWIEHYSDFDGDILDFLELDKITAEDKVWVAVRVMPRLLVEVFAIDCSLSAYASSASAASYASSASSASYAAADAAVYAAAVYAAADAAKKELQEKIIKEAVRILETL